jgi:RHH-type transcriptional regulator, proline utilization regulon repressor / proline dehydrogenase / delta 1-pyrroline-5-carboxylate dehydrogenase
MIAPVAPPAFLAARIGKKAPTPAQRSRSVTEDVFRNEPAADFSQPAVRESMAAALTAARASLGQSYPLFIDGKDVAGRPAVASLNPARPAQVVGHACQATAEDLDAAVAAARVAFSTWREVRPEARAAYLVRAASALRGRIWEASALLVFEVGKPWDQANHDVTEAIDFLEYYAREMVRLGTPVELPSGPGEPESNRLFYEPRGVAAVIAPWNFPLAISCGMVSAAIVTGNCVVYKPSSLSPVTGYLLVDVFREAGLPPGVFNYVPCGGGSLGDRLVDHADVALIAFTGSREVGLRIGERAAKPQPGQRHMKKVITELGGKNAIIVDEGADVEGAVPRIVRSAFAFQGQKCSACSRVIALESVYDELLEKLVSAARTLRMGPPESYESDLGPVIDAAARARIMSYIDSPELSGRVVYRGEVPDSETSAGGFYVPVTIVGEVSSADRVAQDELFGPVLSVMRARDFDHALDLAVSTPYALTGGVFSSDPERLAKAVVRFRVGNLYLNRAITGAVVGRQPFGGFGLSGGGTKAGGSDYLPHFMNPRVLTERRLGTNRVLH